MIDKLFKNNIYDPEGQLISIGTKLKDFEEIKNFSNNTSYTVLGIGNFAYVELMKAKGKKYAIKKLKRGEEKKSIYREITIMGKIKNSYFVELIGVFIDKENKDKYNSIIQNSPYEQCKTIKETKDIEIYCLVMEYIQKGSLSKYKKFQDNNYEPEREIFLLKILKQSLYALKYLKDNYILHRDIKIDNILLDEKEDVKIGDFGLAVYSSEYLDIDDLDLLTQFSRVGRPDYAAYEVFYNMEYDYKIDLYGLGTTFTVLM